MYCSTSEHACVFIADDTFIITREKSSKPFAPVARKKFRVLMLEEKLSQKKNGCILMIRKCMESVVKYVDGCYSACSNLYMRRS